MRSDFHSWDDTGASAKDELRALQTHVLRRLAQDHLKLPQEVNVFVNLQCPVQALRRLEKRRESLRKALRDASLGESERARKAASLKALRAEQLRACGLGKTRPVARYLKQYLEDHAQGAPFIVFAYHKEMFAALEDMLSAMPVTFAVVNGDTSQEERRRAFEAFDEGNVRCFVLSLTMTTGLNMQRADTCFFAELRWSPGEMRQAQTRVCRQGTTHARVRYVWLFGGAVDEEVYDKCVRKEARVAQVLKRQRVVGADDADEGTLTLSKRRRDIRERE